MYEISVKFLGKETRDLISALLNPKKIIPNERGLCRDWHGLAELCSIGGEIIPNIERSSDPVSKVLEIWAEKNKNDSTIKKLVLFLEMLDRFDVIDDITPLLDKDVEYFRANPNGFTADLQDIDDRDIITYDDAERKREGLPPQTYDAFVLFDEDDIGFATDIVNTMEAQYNMKLCVKDRDVVGGEYNHDSVIRLIATRCNRVIVVVSPSFLDSPTNKFFYTLASMDGIEKQRRKIIPCLYKKCPNLPIDFKAFHLLDYTRSEKLFGSFWDQLFKSLKVITPPSPRICENSSATLQRNTENRARITETSRSSNHVKFALLDNQQQTQDDLELPAAEINEVISVSSTSTLGSTNKELKKQNSFFNKCRKFLHHKIEKKGVDDKTEVHQINGLVPKKKKFWKSNKLKLAVAN